MRAATSALPLVILASFVACNAITGVGDLTRANSVAGDGGNEGGAPCGGADLTSDANNCGTCGNACGASNYCASSACVPGCSGGLLYVSPTGNDASEGCTTSAPLQTLTHALALANAQGSTLVQEIHACKGTYQEPQITLDFKSSLRGSYDCATWKRTATFGYPSFDATNASEIDSSATTTSANVTTLAVGGSTLDKTVVVDGWTIRGSSIATTTVALGLGAGSPQIKDNRILGGSPTEGAAPNASIGIQIGAAGSPEITSCNIDGGGGKSTSTNASAAGSVGILIGADSGNPNVHGNAIGGGSGSALSGSGSIGMAIGGGSFATANAIAANTISGGTGKVTTSGAASIGIASVATTSVELDGNTINGGSGSCATASSICTVSGISAGVGTLIARGNKIYAGDATGSPSSGSIGISGSGLTSFIAENNMIHGGNKAGGASHGSAVGIELTETTAPSLRNNTIYSGNAGSDVSTTATAIVIAPSVSGIVAVNNLIATSGARDAGLVVSCSPNLVAAFENNVFLEPTDVVIFSGGGTGTCPGIGNKVSYATVSDAEGFLRATNPQAAPNDPKVSGNGRLVPSCGADTSCTINSSCGSAAGCAAAVITSWSAADTGFGTLLSDGWKINPVCAVSKGGLDIAATLKTDFYGAARTAPLSVGADEQDATCTN